MVCEFVPLDTPVIIVYDSIVFYIQCFPLLDTTYTNQHHIRIVSLAISRMLNQRIETANLDTSYSQAYQHNIALCPDNKNPTLHKTVITQIRKIPLCDKKWIPAKYITVIDT